MQQSESLTFDFLQTTFTYFKTVYFTTCLKNINIFKEALGNCKKNTCWLNILY